MSFRKIDEHCRKLEALEHALAILGADEATHMAVGGGEKRAEAMSALAGMHHRQATAPDIAGWIDAAGNEQLDDQQKAALRVQRARGRREIDEETIFQTIAAQRALVDQATRETTQTRRLRARRAHLQPRPALPASAPADEPVIALPHFPVEVWE